MIPPAIREAMTAAIVGDWGQTMAEHPERRTPSVSRVAVKHVIRVLEEQSDGSIAESLLEVPAFLFWMGRPDRV